MTSIVFNLPENKTYFNFQKTLDGVTYLFTIRYLSRVDSWVLDIGDLVKGINIVGGVNLTDQFKYKDIPQGDLGIVDLDNLLRDADGDNFPSRISLSYTEPENDIN